MTSQKERDYKVVFISNLKGFTEKSRKLGDSESEKLLHEMIALESLSFYQHGGLLNKSSGDTFLTIFTKVDQAVVCAIDIQQKLTEINKGRDDNRQIWLRIGIDCGEINITQLNNCLDIIGIPVNKAKSLEAMAKPGGVLISLDVFNNLDIVSRSHFKEIMYNLKGFPDELCYYYKQFGAMPPKNNEENHKEDHGRNTSFNSRCDDQIVQNKKVNADNIDSIYWADGNIIINNS